jgi:cell division protein FtsL
MKKISNKILLATFIAAVLMMIAGLIFLKVISN